MRCTFACACAKVRHRAAVDIATSLPRSGDGYRGDVERGFEWLERAHRQRGPGLSHTAEDQLFKCTHADAKWPSFVRELGLGCDQRRLSAAVDPRSRHATSPALILPFRPSFLPRLQLGPIAFGGSFIDIENARIARAVAAVVEGGPDRWNRGRIVVGRQIKAWSMREATPFRLAVGGRSTDESSRPLHVIVTGKAAEQS